VDSIHLRLPLPTCLAPLYLLPQCQHRRLLFFQMYILFFLVSSPSWLPVIMIERNDLVGVGGGWRVGESASALGSHNNLVAVCFSPSKESSWRSFDKVYSEAPHVGRPHQQHQFPLVLSRLQFLCSKRTPDSPQRPTGVFFRVRLGQYDEDLGC